MVLDPRPDRVETGKIEGLVDASEGMDRVALEVVEGDLVEIALRDQIGRASCRERVCNGV